MAHTQFAHRPALSTEYGITTLPKLDPVLASNKAFRAADGLDVPGAALTGPAPACAGSADPEQWFPVGAADADAMAQAVAVCAGCPLRTGCLEFGQATRSDGVWGGQLLAKGKPAALSAPAGRPPSSTAVA